MEKLIEDLLLDEEIKEFVKKNKINNEKILYYYSQFALKKENDDVCSKCLKDGKCNNKNEFCKCELKYTNDKVSVNFVKCKYENIGKLNTIFYNQDDNSLYVTTSRGPVLKALSFFKNEYFNNGYSKGVYLYGGYGQGKSFILYSFAKELVKLGKNVTYAYYPDLIRQIKSAIGTNQVEKLVLELKKIDILMLDDLGGENNTSFTRDEILGPILQYRMNHRLPVFATSNYSVKELSDHFADTFNESDVLKAGRVIQRLSYLMTPIELVDKDYRNESK